MARKKKQRGPAKPHKAHRIGGPEDYAEHLKRTQSTKKRKRKPKGTPGGGQFQGGGSGHIGGGPEALRGTRNMGPTGAARKGRLSRKGGHEPKFTRPNADPVPFGTSGSNWREQMAMNTDRARHQSARANQRDSAYYKTLRDTGATRGGAPEVDEATVTVTHSDVRRAEMARKDATWKTGKGTFRHPGAEKGKYTTPTQFLREETPPSMQKQISKDMDDPNSWMNKGLSPSQRGTARLKTTDSLGRPAVVGKLSPAQRRRLDQMVKGLQDGKSYQEMVSQLSTERRGRKASKAVGKTAGARNQDVKQTLDSRSTRGGRRNKYETLKPRTDEINVGLSAQHVDKISDLARMMPNMTDRDLVKLQQAQRETIWSDQIERNAKWAQETRAANMTDAKPGERRDPNRVVFFTTSLGSPAPSVPANSLIGQYIIRRRKNMLMKEGVVNPRDPSMQGNFPDAVRDMHIVEASTGVALGAQGDVGAFQRTGFRVGTKKSPGYGKPVPVGSQILYDSQGRPMYDAQGNIRYSEGATRRFNLTTPDLGFRVFIG